MSRIQTRNGASGLRINLYKVAGNSRGRVSLLGCHVEVNAGATPVATKALFFHYSRVALAIVEIVEGKLAEI